MKLPTLALVFSAFLGLSQASYLPGFIVQDNDVGSILQDSTKLITNCGDAEDILTIDYVALSPDPPVKGEDLQIDFKGYLSETVPNGTVVEIIVKYGVVKLIQKKFDFCDKIQEVDEKCPIPQGDLTFNKVVALPKEIPPGKYTVHAEIITPEKKRVACLIGQTIFPRN
ncbi:phosphatidylglycerol phosphatidylinositol transfer protein [Mucor ambiguus]|uniref:Phosphatidylglycerol/phosphatidylinositol transfer protein n=1 Tax=Mucor ambiguus TaxID=91626 RepID=A0A0C9LUF5_9FUNG|nr:phosphatidylglycerol phosphatidylinositol transfer protein [Mucor ambiguus]